MLAVTCIPFMKATTYSRRIDKITSSKGKTDKNSIVDIGATSRGALHRCSLYTKFSDESEEAKYSQYPLKTS